MEKKSSEKKQSGRPKKNNKIVSASINRDFILFLKAFGNGSLSLGLDKIWNKVKEDNNIFKK